jgi:hypothetical protein
MQVISHNIEAQGAKMVLEELRVVLLPLIDDRCSPALWFAS